MPGTGNGVGVSFGRSGSSPGVAVADGDGTTVVVGDGVGVTAASKLARLPADPAVKATIAPLTENIRTSINNMDLLVILPPCKIDLLYRFYREKGFAFCRLEHTDLLNFRGYLV